ncbi:hypothetical protein HELRODRAFT_192910 [Helobdella robusta]|uniref:Uncharacterized protein n=1 Tax=Helobdella robusta TaxID=6412 RepID=T1FUF2_HELRO|nr:hypothetical protein HELRODRAFT_192910 [Helobdella robusta]ESN98422.1 hypothetical protein HELRODRAFT_192910 [Helobdella robusta]
MIEILLTKKEREEMEKKEREMAHKQWEAEKSELSSFKRRNSYGGTGTRKEFNKPRTAFHEKQQANKHSVEQRLEHQRLEFEEYQRQLKMKHESDFQRVNSLRTSKSQQNLLKTKLKSLQSEQKQESISQQNRKSMENLSQLKKNIDTKLQTAEQNALMKKEDSKKSKEDLHSRAEQSRLRVLQLEEEMRMYQMELLQFNEKQLQHADHLAKRRLAEKKEAACKERLEKEKIHRNNYKRLAEEEDRRNAEMERMIASKDLKVELLMKEKQEAIARNRAKAQASQMMREQVRNSSSLQTTVKRLNDLQDRQQHLFNYTYTSNNNNSSSLYYQQPQPKKLGNGSGRSSETNSLFSYAISPSQQQNQRNTYTENSKNIDDSYNFDASDDANDTLTFRNNSLKYTRDGCDDYEDQNVDDDLNDYDLNAYNDDVSYR